MDEKEKRFRWWTELKNWWNYKPRTFQEEVTLARKYVLISIIGTVINVVIILLQAAKLIKQLQ